MIIMHIKEIEFYPESNEQWLKNSKQECDMTRCVLERSFWRMDRRLLEQYREEIVKTKQNMWSDERK